MRTRGLVLFLSFVGALLVVLALSPPAGADISWPCEATIAGVSVKGMDTGPTATPVKLKEHSTVAVAMSAASEISHLAIQLHYGPFSWTVHDEPSEGTSWSKTLDVDDYSKWGVGLYRATGQSTGSGLACTGEALVEIEGSPLSTPAGIAGVAGAVVGAAGLVGSAAVAGAEGRRRRSEAERRAAARRAEGAEPVGGPPERFRFAPRVSILGLVGGLLVGAGGGLTLQQFAVLYPTTGVMIAELAVGVGTGLVLPSLVRLRGVRAANKVLGL